MQKTRKYAEKEKFDGGASVMNKAYSVLMSVYQRERPEFLRAAITSILNQTLQAKEIILVCDGPLTEELEQVLEEFSSYLTLIRLKENGGLGKALAEGLKHCQCEWVVRMDSDDLAVSDRCEKQMAYVQQHPETDVLSGTVAEFTGDALTPEGAAQQVCSHRRVPETNQEIGKYITYRNPMNHPCVMLRRTKALEAENYQPCSLFEDYDLWVRMFQNQCVFANLGSTLLFMRVNEMHKRRGGMAYARAIRHFWKKMYQRGMISLPQYLIRTTARVAVSLCPNQIRKIIYDRKLRDR